MSGVYDMEYAFYNPSEESRSCVVRTMTKLSGKPYETVKSELTALAAEMEYPAYNEPEVFEAYMEQLGMRKCIDDCGLRVRELKLARGTYCVFCTNHEDFFHLMPVIDGVIYDRRNDSQDLYVLAVYRKTDDAQKDGITMVLRPYQAADADIICKWIRTEKELYQWSADRFCKFPLTGADINENYAPQIESGRFFPLTAVDDADRVIGHFIIRYPDANDDSSVRFGFVVLDPAYRGKGCGSQMMRLGIAYAKEHLHVKRIDLGVFANNESAQHCYSAAGFREYSRRQCEMPVGTWECIDMELFTEDESE